MVCTDLITWTFSNAYWFIGALQSLVQNEHQCLLDIQYSLLGIVNKPKRAYTCTLEIKLALNTLSHNVIKLKQRLNFAYKRAWAMSQKQAQKYKLSYDIKVKGTQLQIDDLVLVKRVAWKGRHKIQNKWEPEEYVVLEQPNKSVPV